MHRSPTRWLPGHRRSRVRSRPTGLRSCSTVRCTTRIPQPDRSVDNSTLWKPDYNTAHYNDMYFNRMAKYFERQSSNRYSVVGDVNGWVKVPFNEARYGRNFCGGIVCNKTWVLVRDALAFWVQGQLSSGKTHPRDQSYLKTFDLWDRYDPTATATSTSRTASSTTSRSSTPAATRRRAIRSRAPTPSGATAGTRPSSGGGPAGSRVSTRARAALSVAVARSPNNPTGIWVGDYTMQPENGGLGVFAHEYAHDLGLPDLYDTSGNTGGAENSTGFWTLMSSGANIGDGGPNGIGDAPSISALGEVPTGLAGLRHLPGRPVLRGGAGRRQVPAHARSERRRDEEGAGGLRRAARQADQLEVFPPKTGSYAFWSTMGDDLNTTMTRLGVSGTSLTAQVIYEIEEDWDYAFLEASTNGGTTWLPVATNLFGHLRRPERVQYQRHRPDGVSGGYTGVDRDAAGRHQLDPVPLPDRSRRGRKRLRRRRHRDQRGPVGSPRKRTKAGPSTASSARRASKRRTTSTPTWPRSAAVRRLRHVTAHGLQLRLPRLEARLGRALPVPGWLAGQLLGYVVRRQQRR